MIPVGTMLWYKPAGHPGPLAAIVVKSLGITCVNVMVLDDGTGQLTDDLGADIKRDVHVAQNYKLACFGECSWPTTGGAQ